MRNSDIEKYREFFEYFPDKIIKLLYGKENVFNFDVKKINNLPDLKTVIMPS